MTLHAEVGVRRGTLALRATVDVDAGETLAVVGPNGAGKSTLLDAIAGVIALDEGRIACHGRAWDDPAQGDWMPPQRRRVGLLPQRPTLFPHLDVLDNVAYGPRARGASRMRARRAARSWIERLGLESLAARRPAQLSGGEAQRCALARALAADPEVLLLDEPLSAVDAQARLQLRAVLREHLTDFRGPRVLVAHDPRDAFALAERVAVIEEGRLVQVGSAAEISARPRSAYAADLVGLNLLRGQARGGRVDLEGGGTLTVADALDGPVFATVHPRAVALFRERPQGSPRNVWRATVRDVEPAGSTLRVRLEGVPALVAEVTPAAQRELGLRPGARLWAAVKATEIGVDARAPRAVP